VTVQTAQGPVYTVEHEPVWLNKATAHTPLGLPNIMPAKCNFLRSILPSLPTEIASKLRNLCSSPANESVFENLVRFLSGAEHSPDASQDIYEQWSEKQATTRNVLSTLMPDKKRPRDEDQMDVNADSQQSNKRQRVPVQPEPTELDSGDPLMTLHALSATSPIRKKVDITIHKNLIKFTNPTTHASEGSISVSSMKRAFIVPTRGKSKPHWTVVILSSDIPDRAKPIPGSSPDNQQLIFGTDATCTSNFSVTTYPDAMSHNTTLAKGASTLPSLREFLSHLAIPVIEPTVDVFKSACPGIGSNAGIGGIPGVEAHRAAKAGNLWFSKDGILWGESKPCEFWPVTDLISKTEGLRIVGSGRTCSVILTRTSGAEDANDDEENDVGEETEFGMVDSKEREGINEWVRNHRHLFGNQRNKTISEEEPPKIQPTGPLTIRTLTEESDDEDDDFSASVSDLDGSERLSEESSSEDEGNEDENENKHGSGDEHNSDAETEDLEDEDGELDPAKHPLLRPGAMPRMSRAALEMAVDIVENAFVGQEDQEDELVD
jgi:hypothetical protein